MPKKYTRKTSNLAMSWKFRQLPFWERVAAQTQFAIWNDKPLDASVNGCSVFVGHKDESGYGRIHNDEGRLVRLHKAVWEKERGPIPNGKKVLHRCDVPACINIAHLFLGTQAENIADMDLKGRRKVLRGSEQGCSILTETDIPAIRERLANKETCAAIARSYGVSEGLIRHIKKGRIWRHVGS